MNESESDPRQPRKARAQESRQTEERAKSWVNPNKLMDPDPVEGIVFRWVRKSTLGEPDKRNMHMKLREGWEICATKDHPEMAHLSEAEDSEIIEQGGLVLCKTAKEIMEQRSAYYAAQAQGQIEAVENDYMKDADDRMPKLRSQRKTVVRTGIGATRDS